MGRLRFWGSGRGFKLVVFISFLGIGLTVWYVIVVLKVAVESIVVLQVDVDVEVKVEVKVNIAGRLRVQGRCSRR
jgi:hypothetical protein